jgi:hypothetical protein
MRGRVLRWIIAGCLMLAVAGTLINLQKQPPFVVRRRRLWL